MKLFFESVALFFLGVAYGSIIDAYCKSVQYSREVIKKRNKYDGN